EGIVGQHGLAHAGGGVGGNRAIFRYHGAVNEFLRSTRARAREIATCLEALVTSTTREFWVGGTGRLAPPARSAAPHFTAARCDVHGTVALVTMVASGSTPGVDIRARGARGERSGHVFPPPLGDSRPHGYDDGHAVDTAAWRHANRERWRLFED